MYIYIYTRIRRTLLVRGHQAAKRMLPSACPKSSNDSNHKSRIKFSIYFHSFPVLQSTISCLPVCSACSCLLSAVN